MSSTVPSGLPVLARGRHLDPADGSCLMEYVSVLAGLRFSDQPRCTPPALNWLAQRVNDAVSDAARSELLLRAPVLARTCPVDPTALILRTVARAGHDLDPDDRWSRWAARLGARDAVSWRRPGLRSCLLEAFLAVEHRLAALPAPACDRGLTALLDEVLDTLHPRVAVCGATR